MKLKTMGNSTEEEQARALEWMWQGKSCERNDHKHPEKRRERPLKAEGKEPQRTTRKRKPNSPFRTFVETQSCHRGEKVRQLTHSLDPAATSLVHKIHGATGCMNRLVIDNKLRLHDA